MKIDLHDETNARLIAVLSIAYSMKNIPFMFFAFMDRILMADWHRPIYKLCCSSKSC